jgi:hypothetical protein
MFGKWGKVGLAGLLGMCLLAGRALADVDADGDGSTRGKCPKPSYSPIHYWLPAVDRIRAFYCRRPLVYIYPPEQFPWAPLVFEGVHYRCEPVPPAVYTANYPWFPKPPAPRQ